MKAIRWDGEMPIRKAGIYSGVPLDVYHGQKICPGPSVSSSGLRRVLEVNGGSPAHFWNEWSGNPHCVSDPEQKQAFTLGRAAHHLLLGQPSFSKYFAIRPDQWDNWRTKDAQAWRDQQVANGITCLTDVDVITIGGMAESLSRHTFNGLLRGDVERSLFWQDHETGLWVKSRPDSIPTDGADGSDLKVTRSVATPALVNSMTTYGYHQQGALFRWALKTLLMLELHTYSLVFVENKRPHCVRVIVMPAQDLDLGHRQNRDALRLIARCIKEGRWPGPDEDHVSELGLTERYRAEADKKIERPQEAA